MAGRICLVNSIIASSLFHLMLVYRWPRSLLDQIERAMRNFIWTGNIDKSGLCRVSWVKACASKEEGGLGIRFIKLMNEAFLHKLAWTVLTDNEAVMGFVELASGRTRLLILISPLLSGVGSGHMLSGFREWLDGFWGKLRRLDFG
ncbi:hypothetical protein ACS0TY_025254 [Phlomoides rotata]